MIFVSATNLKANSTLVTGCTMRLHELQLERFFLPAMAVVIVIGALLFYPVVLRVLNFLLNFLFARRIAASVAAKRAAGGAPGGGPQVKVRQTDIVQAMSAADRAKYELAEKLLSERRILEAAAIFEAIKFQRRAIDELEKAGMIDEACAVLARLGAIPRVAVLYERNKMYEKAAHFYRKANQPENAAKAFVKHAKSDCRYHSRAAECYEAAGKFDDAMSSWAKVLEYDRVLTIAFDKQLFDSLLALAREPMFARVLVSKLTPEQIFTMFHSLEPTAYNAQVCVGLESVLSSPVFTQATTNLFSGQQVLADYLGKLRAERDQRAA